MDSGEDGLTGSEHLIGGVNGRLSGAAGALYLYLCGSRELWWSQSKLSIWAFQAMGWGGKEGREGIGQEAAKKAREGFGEGGCKEEDARRSGTGVRQDGCQSGSPTSANS